MASNIPFIRGQNAVLKIYQDGKPVYVPGKVWDIEENATEAADDVNGEKRARLDKVTNYYSISFDMYQTDQTALDMILAAQAADDAAGLPLKQTAAIMLENRDGTKAAYLLSPAKFGPFKKSQSGRSDNVMINLKIRFQYIKKIPTI